jgi:multicomponent Na+:H+ antiporter subunit D
MGALEAKAQFILFFLLASTILNTGYFAPILYKAYFEKPPEGKGYHEAPAFMVVPLMLTALASVLMGIFPDYFMNIVKAVLR